MNRVHSVSQWPNLRHLGEPLEGAKGLLEAVSFKKVTESHLYAMFPVHVVTNFKGFGSGLIEVVVKVIFVSKNVSKNYFEHKTHSTAGCHVKAFK